MLFQVSSHPQAWQREQVSFAVASGRLDPRKRILMTERERTTGEETSSRCINLTFKKNSKSFEQERTKKYLGKMC